MGCQSFKKFLHGGSLKESRLKTNCTCFGHLTTERLMISRSVIDFALSGLGVLFTPGSTALAIAASPAR